MEKRVEFKYEDPACSTEEVGHDTVKSLTVATNMLHYHRTRPQLRTTVTAHMFGLARRLLLIPTGLTLMWGCWPDVSEASVASAGMAGVTRLCSVSRILWRASPHGDGRQSTGRRKPNHSGAFSSSACAMFTNTLLAKASSEAL